MILILSELSPSGVIPMKVLHIFVHNLFAEPTETMSLSVYETIAMCVYGGEGRLPFGEVVELGVGCRTP
jgi:hypothetical protein